mmetsp:Transcript_26373/g.39073  ORF Transcript_26373/g.39073 Transcript_26373/m.39073 type:complete len:251 (-) Transcript_26373:80-832(-)
MKNPRSVVSTFVHSKYVYHSIPFHIKVFKHLVENSHDRNGSRNRLHSEKGGHSNHCSTSILQLNNLVTISILLRHLLGESHPVKSTVTRFLGGLIAPVVSRVSYTLSLSDGDEENDSSEQSRLLCSDNSKSLGPVRHNGHSWDVHAKSHTSNMGSPNSGPCKHALTSVLDLSFLKELGHGEHVGESVVSLLNLSKRKRIPCYSSNLFETSSGKNGGGLCNLRRSESSCRCNKSSSDGEGKIGHVGGLFGD